ncbi:MAG: hypothetical protein AB7F32_06545 [Victivallaceae bacterium]
MKKKSSRQSGQVLLIAVVVLFALILGSIMLFDYHNTIRAKIKVETAQQAAAMAGANWQVTGLNMIGQLNLVKASILVDDGGFAVPYVLTDEYRKPLTVPQAIQYAIDRRASRVQALSEAQSRVSFVVPLLGCLAVQQTAKQNGMPANNTMFEYYASRTLPIHDDRERPIQGYDWFTPYLKLVSEIASQGAAVRVNSRNSEMPEVWSSNIGSLRLLLSDPGLYRAIQTDDYCYWQLMKLAKQGTDPAGNWWRADYNAAPFVEESELMTLGITYGGSDVSTLDLADGYASNWQEPAERLTTGKLNEVNWALYDSRWFPTSYDENAYRETQSNWQRGYWLRNDIKPGLLYEGAYTAVDNYINVPRFNRTAAHDTVNATRLLNGNTGAQDRTLGYHRSQTRTTTVGHATSGDGTIYGVVAKPLGYFNNGRDAADAPINSEIILPVFREATIIPSTMPYALSMLTNGPDDLKRFLIWLSVTSSLDDPPDGTAQYRDALLKLESPDYLRKIYNPAFAGVDLLSPELLFTDTYKFDANPGTGAGWLQEAWLGSTKNCPYVMEPIDEPDPKKQTRRDLVPDNVATQVTAPGYVEFDGSIRTYFGTKKQGYHYFLTKNGKILTNEDVACGRARWAPGPGNFTPGNNTGPGRL